MRADEHTLVALDAQIRVPNGNFLGDIPLFPLRGSDRPTSIDGKSADREQVPLPGEHHGGHAFDKIGCLVRHGRRTVPRRSGLGGNRHLVERREGRIDRGKVLLDHFRPLAGIRLLDRLLDLRDGLVTREDAGNREETRLHDRVDPRAHARLAGHFVGVDRVELQLALDNRLLRLSGQRVPNALRPVHRVDKNHRPGRGDIEHVKAVEEFPLVHADEIGAAHEIGAADRARAEAEVGNRDGPRLLRVVNEIPLGEIVRLLADDLDGVLVGTDGSIRPQAVKDGAGHIIRLDIPLTVPRQRRAADVIHDADGEMVPRCFRLEVVEDGLGHGRGEFLRREPVTAADNDRIAAARQQSCRPCFCQRRDDILVKRFPDGARFLGPVEHGDRFDRVGQSLGEALDRPRTEQPDLEHAGLLALGIEPRGALGRGLGAGPDHDHDLLGLRIALVIEQPILTSCKLGKLRHDLLKHTGHGRVERVAGLARLEKCVRVLRRAPQDRRIGREGARAESGNIALIDQRTQRVLAKKFDLAHFMRSAEPVEEVHEGDARAQGRRMRDSRHVLRLLHVGSRQHRHSDLPAGHDVRVVAENRKRMGCKRPRGDMQHERVKLPCDLVKIRDHQQQALRCRETRGHRPGLEHPV